MEKYLAIVMLLMFASQVVAWDNGYENEYDNSESYNDRYEREREREEERNREYPYESSTGTRYKYDLSKPVDRIMYDVDPAAQIKDRVNPMVDIDRARGEYGGGSE